MGKLLVRSVPDFLSDPQRHKKVISVDLSLEQAYWWAGSVWSVHPWEPTWDLLTLLSSSRWVEAFEDQGRSSSETVEGHKIHWLVWIHRDDVILIDFETICLSWSSSTSILNYDNLNVWHGGWVWGIMWFPAPRTLKSERRSGLSRLHGDISLWLHRSQCHCWHFGIYMHLYSAFRGTVHSFLRPWSTGVKMI